MFRLRKLTYVAVLVCVLLLNINVLATQQRDEAVNEAAELNDQAVACVKDHEYPRAVDLLKRTIALQPNLFMTQAIASYKRALTLNPEYAEAHHNLAVLYLQRGQRSLALEQYHLLQSIDYELSQKLLGIIFQDKILNVKDLGRE